MAKFTNNLKCFTSRVHLILFPFPQEVIDTKRGVNLTFLFSGLAVKSREPMSHAVSRTIHVRIENDDQVQSYRE